jgi:hypothetical protein
MILKVVPLDRYMSFSSSVTPPNIRPFCHTLAGYSVIVLISEPHCKGWPSAQDAVTLFFWKSESTVGVWVRASRTTGLGF